MEDDIKIYFALDNNKSTACNLIYHILEYDEGEELFVSFGSIGTDKDGNISLALKSANIIQFLCEEYYLTFDELQFVIIKRFKKYEKNLLNNFDNMRCH